jgi:hypothetical protein
MVENAAADKARRRQRLHRAGPAQKKGHRTAVALNVWRWGESAANPSQPKNPANSELNSV